MLSGCYLSAEVESGQAPIYVTFTTFLDQFRTARSEIRQPLPWLTMWDLSLPDGSMLYLCDFADADARGAVVPTQVTFNGHEYTTIRVRRTDMAEETGAQRRFTVTVHDPRGIIRSQLLAVELDGQPVTIWIARYDLLAAGPAEAWRGDTEVQEIMFSSGGIITIAMGRPNLFQRQYPRGSYHKLRCSAQYRRRFNPRNSCNYPSNEFESGTEDILVTAAADEEAFKHGWSAINTHSTDGMAHTNQEVAGSSDRALRLLSTESDILWLDGDRNGPFVFRRIGDHADHDTDFDCYVKLKSNTAREDWMVGILCQSLADESDWLFWGLARDASDTYYRKRSTVNGTSTDADTVVGAPTSNAFRMKRVGNDFTLYRRLDDETKIVLDESDWTQVATQTISLGAPIRLGVVLASDDDSGTDDDADAYCFHFRYLSGGGFPACDRGLDSAMGCNLHKNGYQFGGKRGMPNGLVFIR